MKWKTVIPIVVLAIVLCVASACGGGVAPATPTPTPMPTPTSTPTITPIPTPTPEATEYPPLNEGKGKIAGHITWGGKSWRLEHGKQARVDLFTRDAFQLIGDLLYQQDAPVKRGAADTEGYFLFKNIEPGYYYVLVYCPGALRGQVYGPIEVVADDTNNMGEIDPIDGCTGK